MANQILTISMITRESLRVLENNLTFTKGVNREYDDAFGKTGAKIGNTLNLRLPARYVGRTGPTLSIENQTETFFPLTLNTQFGVDVQFTSQDMELSMDDFSERFLAPAMAAVANKIDRDGLAQGLNVYNAVGTPGTTPTTLATYLAASKIMKFMAAPQDNLRSIVIDPSAEASIVNALTTLFNPSQMISDQYKDGTMGKAIGFKWSSDANVNAYTIGAQGGTPIMLSSGGSQTGASLNTQGWSNSITGLLNQGDIFTIAGVFSVNPQSRQSTGLLQQFVVTAPVSSNGSGLATIPISPSIVASGQFQNVSAAAAQSAAITVLGSAATVSPMNLAFHRDAFVLASADLPLPRGVHMAERVSSKKVGLSVRMIQAYDVVNDIFPCRLDVLYGWATPYPQLACRIQG
jgi:hypothetical protein